jgi:PhoPQ-activated pathogenicity-related protein
VSGMSETHGNLRLYPDSDGTWTVSDSGSWLPGIYDSKVTAIAAAALPDAVLEDRLQPICHVDGENRPITLADVEAVGPPG